MAWTVKFFSKLKVEFLMEILADALKQLVTTQVSHMRQPRLKWTSFDLLPVWERGIVPEELLNRVLLK